MDSTPDNSPIDAEEKADSPFQPPGHSDWACRADSDELWPESPRLGIIHFLGWMACVAVAFSVRNSIMLVMQEARAESVASVALGAMYSIGMGTAWGALVLWLSRRYRGLPFPVFPGEYLWLVYGIANLIGLIVMGVYVVIASESGTTIVVLLGMMDVAVAIVFLAAAVKVRVKRWRVLLLVLMATSLLNCLAYLSHLLVFVGGLFFAPLVSWLPLVPLFVEPLVLAIVVARDLFQRQRCPWSHWTGVAVLFWMSAASFAQYVCAWFDLY